MFRNLFFPDFLEEESIYDQMDQFLDDQQPQNEDDESEDEDYDDEENEGEGEGSEDEELDEDEDDVDVIVLGSSRVSDNDASISVQATITVPDAPTLRASDHAIEERGEKRRRSAEDGEVASSSNREKGDEGVKEGEWNRGEIDGLFCPICMEAWASDGEHQVCCLPCGHVYGMSCIKRWIQQNGNSGKCPQCNVKCKLKDVRKIYASRIVVVDEESQKRIRYLEAKCDSLEKKGADLFKKKAEWLKKEADLQVQVHKLTERTMFLERLLEDSQRRSSGVLSCTGVCQGTGTNFSSNFRRQGSRCFVLQKEFRVDDSRLFDIDACSHTLIIARRHSSLGGTHVLTKMSLISPYEREDITLPSSTKAVRDLRISTSNSRLALIASLGKTLSVLSTESNHIILSYDLPVPAWSCSWDLSSSHYIYAGLQNGMLLVFDMRQTSRPVQSMSGLTSNAVHSIHALSHNQTVPSAGRSILTASSAGLSHWTFGGADERQFLIPETENQGVCISLAYCPQSNDIVASFRPKVETSVDIPLSQPLLSPFTGQGMHGSHVLYSRVGSRCYQRLGSACATVNEVRLPKSTIINIENQDQVFASGDEVTHELVLQDLPSFTVSQRLKPHKHPIRDMKCTYAANQTLVGCLSEDTLQLFCDKLL